MTNEEINLRQMLGRNAIYIHVDQSEGYRQFWIVFNAGTHKYILQRWGNADHAIAHVNNLRRSVFFLEHDREKFADEIRALASPAKSEEGKS